MRTIALILLLWCAGSARATLTLVIREAFQSVGTLDSGTPGNLGTVTAGSFYKRAVGPRITNDTTAASLGWSSDFHIEVAAKPRRHEHTLSGQSITNGMWSTWYFIPSITPVTTGATEFSQTRQANTTGFLIVKTKPGSNGNFWTNGSYNFTDTDSGVVIPLMTWFELRHSWEKVSGTSHQYRVLFRTANSSSWTTILSTTQTFQAAPAAVQSGQLATSGSGSAAYFQGRYGMPSLYACTTISTDSTNLVSDVIDPLGTATTWYLNPTTGSDSNDGVTSASAWQTVAKFNVESQFAGLFHAQSYAAGDVAVIDTSSTPLTLTESMTIQTSGLNGRAEIGQTWATLKPYVTISAGDWIVAVNAPAGIYSTTNTVSLATLWENDLWLTHANGANLAAVTNALYTTPGSFWNSGTLLYVHPFGNTDPRSDGKVYDRSNVGIATPAVYLKAKNLNIQDLHIRKTCDANAAAGTPNGGYSMGADTGWQGTNRITHCYMDYFGKHGLGLVANSANGEVTDIQIQAEQGSPYGSQTPYVSYNATTTVSNIIHRYTNCVTLKTVGVVGSTNGAAFGETFYSHNNGGSNQFSLISFSGCNFGGLIDSANSIGSLVISNSIFGGGNGSATNKTVDRCLIKSGFGNGQVGEVTTIRNSIFTFIRAFNTGLASYRPAIGTVNFDGNTVDLSFVPTSTDPTGGFWARTGAFTLTGRDNVFIVNPTNDFTIIQNATNSDSLNLTNNVYYLGSANKVANNYDGSDRTFSQWQGLGFDTASWNANPYLRSDYTPKIRFHGTELGPTIDYSGRYWNTRTSPGAYEWRVLDPPFQMGIR